MYEIIVINKQGASESHRAATRAAIERWLEETWSDPQRLSATVYAVNGGSREVGAKAFGRKRIVWTAPAAEDRAEVLILEETK